MGTRPYFGLHTWAHDWQNTGDGVSGESVFLRVLRMFSPVGISSAPRLGTPSGRGGISRNGSRAMLTPRACGSPPRRPLSRQARRFMRQKNLLRHLRTFRLGRLPGWRQAPRGWRACCEIRKRADMNIDLGDLVSARVKHLPQVRRHGLTVVAKATPGCARNRLRSRHHRLVQYRKGLAGHLFAGTAATEDSTSAGPPMNESLQGHC